jgi:glutathione S-transferase
MKLYGSLVSPYVARIVLAARAKGIDLVPEAPPGGGIKSPEFLALNPMGKMPVLEDGGKYLAESAVILEYLDEAYPQKPLMPSAPLDRAQVRVIARIIDLYIANQSGPFFRNMNPAARNEAEVEGAKKSLAKALADLEHFVSASGPCLTGKSLTLADCTALPSMLMTSGIVAGFGVKDLFEGLPKLSAWWQAMHADPLTGPFCKEYLAAMQAFLSSRRG